MRLRGAICAALVFACALALAGMAHAAFPGKNGKIAFVRDADIFVMNPDGSGEVNLTGDGYANQEGGPAWSPDGTKIAFSRMVDPNFPDCTNPGEVCDHDIFLMNADGTGEVQVTTDDRSEFAPAWKPDGTKITFNRTIFCFGHLGCTHELFNISPDGTGEASQPATGAEGSPLDADWAAHGERFGVAFWTIDGTGRIYTLNADGTGAVPLCCAGSGNQVSGPSWSPDTTALVFTNNGRVARQNPDGSGLTFLTPNVSSISAVWSPDGTKIAFTVANPNHDLYVMNTDGSNQVQITNTPSTSETSVTWQSIPINGYPRPKGATPVHAPLVPAYQPCGSPNRQHGPPLAFASCNPPTQASDELTVGSADSNGKPTRSVSAIKLKTIPGTPPNPPDDADVRLEASITDVYNQGSLTDYAGELRAQTSLRITDKLNTPHPGGPGAGTVSDFSFGFTIPCASTPDPNEGSSCTLNTTADALFPGAIAEGRRAIWQLGQVEVYDGGADDDGDTAADNTLFMKQGVFVP